MLNFIHYIIDVLGDSNWQDEMTKHSIESMNMVLHMNDMQLY